MSWTSKAQGQGASCHRGASSESCNSATVFVKLYDKGFGGLPSRHRDLVSHLTVVATQGSAETRRAFIQEAMWSRSAGSREKVE